MSTARIERLGRYQIVATLGKGAMGVVYAARDPKLHRDVAIKTIVKSALDGDSARQYSQRFTREAQAVARLNHPGIVQVHDFGEEDDTAYIVMEYVSGRDLESFFETGKAFELRESVRIMTELLDALEFAHRAGVVHRDIKPANVMLDPHGRVKLTDFGVARIEDSERTIAERKDAERTQAGAVIGTPAYMSPEQVTGAKIDHRSDIFSAGIIFYQLLTGERPFSGTGSWTIAKKIVQDDPPPPSTINVSVSVYFDRVVSRSLAKQVESRFQSAQEFASALKIALEGKLESESSAETVLRDPPQVTRPLVTPQVPTPRARQSTPGTSPGTQELDLEFWRAIKDGDDPNDFELYLEQFPNGVYANLARRKIAKLRGLESSGLRGPSSDGLRSRSAAEEIARRESDAKAKREAEEFARRQAEERARREAEVRAAGEAEQKARQEAAAAAERAKQELAAERERLRREAEALAKKRMQSGSDEAELEFWRAIKDGNDAEDFELYVQQFPTGIYTTLAKRKIAKLRGTSLEDTASRTQDQEKKEFEDAIQREAEVKAKIEAEKARLEAEMARREEELRKREAEAEARWQAAERARQEAEIKAKREAEVAAEKIRQEAEKARREAEERARKEVALAAEKARHEAEKARREGEERAKREAGITAEKVRQEAEKARREAEERARKEVALAAEKARHEAEKARREAEERVKKEAAATELARSEMAQIRKEATALAERAKLEAQALARKQAEERTKRDAEFKKREAELKAQVTAGGKKASPAVPIVVGIIVAAVAGSAYLLIPSGDADRIRQMEQQLERAKKKAEQFEQAKQKEEEARAALEKARAAEAEAKRLGDLAKQRELAEARQKAEAELRKRTESAKTAEQQRLAAEKVAAEQKERQSWDGVRISTNPRDFDSYLAAYPNGRYADQARAIQAKLLSDLRLREEHERKLEIERARLEEERRLQKAKLDEELAQHRKKLEEERRKAQEEQQQRMQTEAQERERQIAKEKQEPSKGGRIFVPPTF